MKEITRIHIAKISYDAEIDAKKQLDAYLKTLEAYSNDTEIIGDVEIRITEILAERGVAKNGVITEADVAALKEQLGEPREFMADDDETPAQEDMEKIGEQSRKLYRDTDHAVLGGVLAGIAAFFKISPMWVRIVFILLALASFGTMLLVYIVLWIAIPSATSAADKLQMAGRPVTVSSIRELNENETGKPHGDRTASRRVILTLLGVFFVIAASLSALATIAAILGVTFSSDARSVFYTGESDFLLAAFILAVASGVLFTALMILSAYASFTQKLTKRVVISSCIIIVLGLASFTAAVVTAKYGSDLYRETVTKNTQEAALSLPQNIQSAKALVADTPGMKFEYVVATGAEASKSVVRAYVPEGEKAPEVNVTLQDGTLQVKASKTAESSCGHGWCLGETQLVRIYGPELQEITAKTDTSLEYQGDKQDALKITAAEDADVNLATNVLALTVESGEKSMVAADAAVVRKAVISVHPSAQMLLGTVESLTVDDQKSCPAHTREARVSVANVTSGRMTFNGKNQIATTLDSQCTEITIESEDNR